MSSAGGGGTGAMSPTMSVMGGGGGTIAIGCAMLCGVGNTDSYSC